MKAGVYAPGVDFDEDVTGDRYFGTAQALIDAGVISMEHLPEVSSVTFFKGVKVDGRTVKGAQFEHWMQVRIWGSHNRVQRFVVIKGVTREERCRREEARRQEVEELARTAPKKDPGFDGVHSMNYRASATFVIGEEVFAHGKAATVTSNYKLIRVADEEGEFSNGVNRADYIPGYLCRIHDSGEEFFYPAHAVRSKSGAVGHLRLVSGARQRREISFSIRSLA
ncbi:hypothetical protein J2W35_004918 [Variovorax boronicumulans]|uniref:hypothetical protein n=1 Tax=Variovorax boronicumulans TaxID=436515 RepID=UPI002786F52A|nr:hypothetical protein [Variovorax boronicumulans]MDQ0084549.1 hypothetical protein [Variovorax boronicumulans]